MKMKSNKTVKWAIFYAIGLWAMLSFIVLAGDEDPQNPMPLLDFFLIKTGALASFALSLWVGKLLNRAGFLPEISED